MQIGLYSYLYEYGTRLSAPRGDRPPNSELLGLQKGLTQGLRVDGASTRNRVSEAERAARDGVGPAGGAAGFGSLFSTPGLFIGFRETDIMHPRHCERE